MEQFSVAITKLINKEDLTYEEMSYHFRRLMNNEETEMQQGAFLSALAAKGESPEEIKAVWQAIMDLDTVDAVPEVDGDLLENSGTGMDRLKTFNISSLAALIAAADGVKIARHGARAITSKCGAIDVLEAVGVYVEAEGKTVKESVESVGIGIYNGMSPAIHPFALGRILSQISFGTVLNVAASLANPANPTLAVRGVYEKEMCVPVAQIMKQIGYKRAFVLCGLNDEGISMIDEASTLGDTAYAFLKEDGTIEEGTFSPESVGLTKATADDIRAHDTKEGNVEYFINVLTRQATQAQTDIVCLNAGLILLVAGNVQTIAEGCEKAKSLLADGKALDKLKEWTKAQCDPADPEAGIKKLTSML